MTDFLGKVFGAVVLLSLGASLVLGIVMAILAFIAQNIVPIGIGVVCICILVLVVIACRSTDTTGRDVYVDAYIPPGTPTLSERQARQRIKDYRDLETRIRANTNR